MSTDPTPSADSKNGEAILQFRYQAEWALWLDKHHTGKTSVWLRHAKKARQQPP